MMSAKCHKQQQQQQQQQQQLVRRRQNELISYCGMQLRCCIGFWEHIIKKEYNHFFIYLIMKTTSHPK